MFSYGSGSRPETTCNFLWVSTVSTETWEFIPMRTNKLVSKPKHASSGRSALRHNHNSCPLEFTAPWGRYHGGQRPSSDDSFHSPTVIPPSALNKLSIMKRYHRRRTCSHTSPRRSRTMVTLHDTRFVECRW